VNPAHTGSFAKLLGSASRPALQGATAEQSPAQRELLHEDAGRVQFARDLRRTIFDAHIFGEPAWDMLLALYVMDNIQRRLSMAELSKYADVPPTTALRWLNYLETRDLIWRHSSSVDKRYVYVELSHKGRAGMDRYFTEVRQAEVFGPSTTVDTRGPSDLEQL
jgi:DNA-binding MarR family transcriptional regulator